MDSTMQARMDNMQARMDNMEAMSEMGGVGGVY